MKIARIALILTVSMLFLLLATGCRCVPSSKEWHFQNYKMEYTFIGGVKKTAVFADVSVHYPLTAAYPDKTKIVFFEDGRVVFNTWDGEELKGTFTYEHEKRNYTHFTINFENGEVANGDSGTYAGMSFLNFTFRGVLYNFADKEREFSHSINNVIYDLRTSEKLTLKKYNVMNNNGAFSLVDLDGNTVHVTSSTAVFAARITSDNNYVPLDQILEGECLAEYIAELEYLIIYYIEPMDKK